MAIAVKRATLFIVLAGSFLIAFAFVRDPHDSFRFIKTLLFRAEAIMLVGMALAWLPSPSPWRNSKHSSAVPRSRTLRVPARSIPRDSPTFLMRTFATKGAPRARDLRRRLAAVNAPQLRAGIFVDEIHSFGRWRLRTGALCDEKVLRVNA